MTTKKLKQGYCKHGINHILPHDCDGCCKELSIPKNHDQRMYKFGYDTARKELIEDVEEEFKLWVLREFGMNISQSPKFKVFENTLKSLKEKKE